MDHILCKIDNARAILSGRQVLLGQTAWERNKRLMKEAKDRREGKVMPTMDRSFAAYGGRWAMPENKGRLTKREQRLASRIADFERMVQDPKFKAPAGAFHRPGSLSK